MTDKLTDFWDDIEEETQSMLPIEQYGYYHEIGRNTQDFIEGTPEEITDVRIELLRRINKIVGLYNCYPN